MQDTKSATKTSLDLKDRKILFELDKNSRQSFAAIGKKVGLSQEVVYYRVSKLKEQGIIRRFQTVSAASRLGYIAPKLYLRFQDLTEEKYKEIYNYLINNRSVFWFGRCQGRWDLLLAYWSRDTFEFGKLLDEFLNKFSPYILEREVSIGKNTIQFNRRWFYTDAKPPVQMEFGTRYENTSVDNIDIEVLRYLADNARLSVVELAKITKTTASTLHYRIKNLEKEKIIVGYKFSLDAHKLGYETCKSFIYLKDITEKRRNQLVQFCKMHPNIINIVLCVGAWDMEIEFEVENFDKFYDIMNEIKERFPDIIKSYESVVFKEEPKQSFVPKSYPEIKSNINKN